MNSFYGMQTPSARSQQSLLQPRSSDTRGLPTGRSKAGGRIRKPTGARQPSTGQRLASCALKSWNLRANCSVKRLLHLTTGERPNRTASRYARSRNPERKRRTGERRKAWNAERHKSSRRKRC